MEEHYALQLSYALRFQGSGAGFYLYEHFDTYDWHGPVLGGTPAYAGSVLAEKSLVPSSRFSSTNDDFLLLTLNIAVREH